MSLANVLDRLRIPVVCAPMFLVSGPELVIGACRSGVLGAFPTINARTPEELDGWLRSIDEALDHDAAPPAANLIVHRSNPRLAPDLERCVAHRLPVIITSVGDPGPVVDTVHGYGGAVLHDVASVRHAHRAAEAGVDGMVLLTAGAGGQTGSRNPFAFLDEVRRFWDGPLALAGGIASGRAIAAAEVAGADLAYLGTRFIAAEESRAPWDYQQMVIDADADDIVLSRSRTGLPANMLRPSLERAGWSATRTPPTGDGVDLTTLLDDDTSPWRDIWSAGHGVGGVSRRTPVARIVDELAEEYDRAHQRSR